MLDAVKVDDGCHKKSISETTIKGIDPSFDNSGIARERGLTFLQVCSQKFCVISEK